MQVIVFRLKSKNTICIAEKNEKKKHEKIGTFCNGCTTILACVYKNVLFRNIFVPWWSMEKMKKFSEKNFFVVFWIFSCGKYSCLFYKKSWQQSNFIFEIMSKVGLDGFGSDAAFGWFFHIWTSLKRSDGFWKP